MLTRALRGVVVGAVVTGVLLVSTPMGVLAGGGIVNVQCDANPSLPGCSVSAGSGEEAGGVSAPGGGEGTGGGVCRDEVGVVIPCERDGGWAGEDGCYYRPSDPSVATISALGGQPPGDGGWYLKMCYSVRGGAEQAVGGPVWVPGGPPVASPEVVARAARARLSLPAVEVVLSPSGDQLVGLPTWLSMSPLSWGAVSASASVPGVSVTATARPVRAVWSTGDGGSVVCSGPGERWTPGVDPRASSPDCGHTFEQSSMGEQGSVFAVSVEVTWEVTWAGAGRSGSVPGLTTTGTVPVRVVESQTVVTR